MSRDANANEPDALKKDFRNFLYLVWRKLGFPKPTKVQYDMGRFLQHGPDKIMLEAFRGVGKTWVTAAFVVWLLYCNPNLKILIVSASKIHADKTSAFCLQIIRCVPELEHLAPRDDQADSKVMFTVGPAETSRDPSVTSLGITGQLTGCRADVIIPDDIETANNSQTQMMREKLKTSTEEFGAILKPGGRIVYLGTPQCEDSIYRALPAKGYSIRIWPARYPDARLREAYGDSFAPSLAYELDATPELEGKPTDPERFYEEALRKAEAEYARSGFALQFMLDTSLSDANRYPLKLSDLIVMNLNPELAPPNVVWAAAPDLIENSLPNVGFSGDRLYRPMNIQTGDWIPYTGGVLAVDPSGRGKDETGYAVVKILHGKLYVTDWGGLIGGYDDSVLQRLANIAKAQKVNLVLVESNFGDGMFTKLLTPFLGRTYPVTTEEVHSVGQKEKRIIDTIEPVLNQHRLVLDRSLVEKDYNTVQTYSAETASSYMGLHQLTRITRDRGSLKHDDRLDALSIGIHYWVESMARDTDQALRDHNEAKMDLELRRWTDEIDGSSGYQEATWITPGGRR